MPDSARSVRSLVFVSLFLAAVALAAFWPALSNNFTSYDDDKYVTRNEHVQGGLSWAGFVWAATATEAANWHPLTWVSHMLDWELFGPRPWGHHLTSLVLHALNAVLLFLLLARMTGAAGRSAFVSALFALHPLHVESVAWVAERKDVLSALFWFLTTWAYVEWTRAPRPSRYALVVVLFALGLAAKPMLVTLPVTLLLLDYWPLGRWSEQPPQETTARRAWRLLREKLPLFALAVASGVVTFVVQRQGGAVRSLTQSPLSARLANAVVAYPAYLWKAIWPSGLAAFYPHPRGGQPLWRISAAALLLVLVTAAAVRLRRRAPHLFVGWFWYVVTLAPVIGIVQVGAQAMADRYTYMPLLGAFVFVSWGAVDLARRLGGAAGPADAARPARDVRWLIAPAAVVVVLLAARTHVECGYWRDSLTLFTRALEVTEDNPVAHDNLGATLLERGRTAEAIPQFEAALQLDPRDDQAQFNWCNALAAQGRADEAIAHCEQAVRMNPAHAGAHNNLAVILAGQGRFEEAASHYRAALRSDPGHAQARNNLGNALSNLGRLDEAIEQFAEAVRLRPGYPQAHYNWGLALERQGRLAQAVEQYREAVRLRPDYVKAHQHLAEALRRLGDEAGAQREADIVRRFAQPAAGQQPPDAGGAGNFPPGP